MILLCDSGCRMYREGFGSEIKCQICGQVYSKPFRAILFLCYFSHTAITPPPPKTYEYSQFCSLVNTKNVDDSWSEEFHREGEGIPSFGVWLLLLVHQHFDTRHACLHRKVARQSHHRHHIKTVQLVTNRVPTPRRMIIPPNMWMIL